MGKGLMPEMIWIEGMKKRWVPQWYAKGVIHYYMCSSILYNFVRMIYGNGYNIPKGLLRIGAHFNQLKKKNMDTFYKK